MAKPVACIQSVSAIQSLRIHCLSFVFGVWVVCKRLARWLWDPKGFASLRARDTPPSCLVDAALGQHKYVKLKGTKLHYVESGSKEQPLILLLHGFPDFWLSWRHQIPQLSQHFRVVALDLRGFGDSDKPLWRASYKIDVILEELRQFIYSLGVTNCSILGHDLGALLGWYLVHNTPSIVNEFFAVSCPHPNVYWTTSGDQWLNFAQIPFLPELDALKEDVKIINKYHKHLSTKDAHLDAYKYTFSRKEDWTGPINYYRNLPFFKINEDSDLVTVPVILITGSKDEYVKLENIVRSTEYCEKFHLKVIDGAGHFPHQENSEMFNKVVLKYLIKKNEESFKGVERSPSKRLIKGLFGAVSNTVKYGNSVIDTVQKTTNGVVGSMSIPSISLLKSNASQCKTE